MSDAPVVVFDPAKDATFPKAERSLEENEAVILEGLQMFFQVGGALMDIRKSGQYRELGYQSFDEYCRGRWGFGKSWASQYIAATKVYRALEVYDPKLLPANLEQALPLASLLKGKDGGEEKLRDTWNEIVESHDNAVAITGRDIRAFLNPSVSVTPSQRPVSEAYLTALDRLNDALRSLRWAVDKGQGKKVPKPVAQRYAAYGAAVGELARAVSLVSEEKTPKPLSGVPQKGYGDAE